MTFEIKGKLETDTRFAIVKIQLIHKSNVYDGKAVIDTGAPYNFIPEGVIQKLKLPPSQSFVDLYSLVNKDSSQPRYELDFKIEGCLQTLNNTFIRTPFINTDDPELLILGNFFLSGCTEFKIIGQKGLFELHL